MKGKFLLIPAVLAMGICLSSCGLMPEEEAVRTAPMVKEYKKNVYEFAAVQRSDLSVTERVTCRYVPLKTQNLSFALGGEVVDKVYVQVGDIVEEGQLLAQLELNGLDEDIVQAEIDVEEYRLRLAALEQQQDIQREISAMGWQALTYSERQRASQELESQLELERRKLEDALTVAELNLEELQKQLLKRQIHAPFSGTLTYVREYDEGEKSEFGIRAIVIADSSMSLFRAETDKWSYLNPGDVYQTTVNKKEYTITVADETELGLEAQEKTEGKKAMVYFTLAEPDFTLEEGDFGSIEVLLDFRADTLHLPIKAVKESGDKKLVFYLREDGLRAYKEVETGIENAKRVEILSGVSEGEQIIID